MAFGIRTDYGPVIEQQRAQLEQARQRSYLDAVDRHGGIKLEKNAPQPREGGSVTPPELKTLRERAPHISNGTTIHNSHFAPDPDGPLGKLLSTIRGLKGSNPDLHAQCDAAVGRISGAYSLLKSPPEYDQGHHSRMLRDKANVLMNMAQSFFSNGEGVNTPIEEDKRPILGGLIIEEDDNSASEKDTDQTGRTDKTKMLGQQIRQMLIEAAEHLADAADYIDTKPDPRPTMEKVGHFKSLETKAAIDVVDRHLEEKVKLLNKAQTQSPTHKSLLADIEVLTTTKMQLEERKLIFEGRDMDHPEWKDKTPLNSKKLAEVAGKKPDFLDKLFAKLGFSAFGTELDSIQAAIDSNDGKRPLLLSSSKMSETDILSKFVAARLAKADCRAPGGTEYSERTAKHTLEEQHKNVLGQQQNWDIIAKKIALTIDGQTKEFTSVLTPHSRLSGQTVLQEGKGVCCHDAASENAANVWQSELKDTQGKQIFRQIRTGVNCAYEIENEKERKAVNENRAKQVLQAHIGSDENLMDKARSQKFGQNQPLVVRNVWVSHLTPDVLRPRIAGQNENEQLMSREQYLAMQSLENGGQPITIKVKDPEDDGKEFDVSVKYEPIMFSIGVNEGAVNSSVDDFLGGALMWSTANTEFNEPSMIKLLGDTGATGGQIGGWVKEAIDANNEIIEADGDLGDDLPFVGENAGEVEGKEKLPPDVRKANAEASNERIMALAKQVQNMWMSKSFMTQGQDPYKMSSRLGVLGYEIGAAVTSNCKSNKDRNSYADAHMKDLAIQMRVKGELRAPDQPRSREEQLNLRALARESGNSELQELNVGGAGYKLKGVDMVFTEQGLAGNDVGFLGVGPFTAT